MPTVDIAHYDYHYLSSGAYAENRAIPSLMIVLLYHFTAVMLQFSLDMYNVSESSGSVTVDVIKNGLNAISINAFLIPSPDTAMSKSTSIIIIIRI